MSECLVSLSELIILVLSTDVYIQALATFLWFVLFLTKRGQENLKKSLHTLLGKCACRETECPEMTSQSFPKCDMEKRLYRLYPTGSEISRFWLVRKYFLISTPRSDSIKEMKKIVTYTLKTQHMFHSHCVLFVDQLFNRKWWSLHVGMERDRTAGFVCQSWWHWWWQADSN